MSDSTGIDKDWHEIMGKDLVLKQLRDGTGKTAEMGTVVRCNLRGFFVENGMVREQPFEVLHSQQYKVGETDAVPGIEMAVRFSKVGDLLRVRFTSKFGYGDDGRPPVVASDGKDGHAEGEAEKTTIAAIPPGMDLEYELDILSHLSDGQIDPDLLAKHPMPVEATTPGDGAGEQGGSPAQRHAERLLALTELLQRKEAGNRWFSYGDFKRAARAYSKATQVADRYFNGSANTGDPNAKALQGLSVTKSSAGLSAQEQAASVAEANEALAAAEREKEAQRRRFEPGDEEVVGAYLSCLNNMAASQLKLGEFGRVKEICVRVLEMDPANHKALLRAAKAALATHEYEECDLCLQRLTSVAPPGSSAAAAAAAERKRLKQAQQDYRARNKQMSTNMAKQLFPAAGSSVPDKSSKSTTSSSSSSTGDSPVAAERPVRTSAGAVAADPPPQRPAEAVAKDTAGTAPSVADRSGNGKGAGATVAPAGTTQAPAVAAGADRGLLLLLATSLLVLIVSVAMVLWGQTSPTPRDK